MSETPPPLDGLARRALLKAMAASLAMAGLSGCGPGDHAVAVPYVEPPEGYVPGQVRHFASAVPFDGYAQPIIAECHAGRPTRLDGNPNHPLSGSAVSAIIQASVLELYDPDRSGAVTFRGRITPWEVFEAAALAETERLKTTGGRGFRLLTGPVSSPTLLRQIAALRGVWPEMVWHGPMGATQASQMAFGRALQVLPRLDRAAVVVSLEDDLLGPGPLQVFMARAWAEQRSGGAGLPLLFVAESTPSLTGAMAHRRLAVASNRLPALAAALAGQEVSLSAAEAAWVGAVRQAVAAHPGQAVITAGAHQPVETQAQCLTLAHRWGSAALAMTAPVLAQPDASLAELVAAMTAGTVETLLMLDVNPAYTSPGEIDFAAALTRVGLSLHAGQSYDETAALSQWHLPLAHPLESWSDCRAADGSAILLQPLIAPLHQGRTAHQVLAGLLGPPASDALAPLRQTWEKLDEPAWRRALEDGVVANTAFPLIDVNPQPLTVAEVIGWPGIEVVFRPDPCIWDGRFANSAWLQELPKPLTKLTWDNAILLGPALAARLGVESGGLVEVAVNGRRLRGPAWVQTGQAEETVTLVHGYGRRRGGRLAEGLGYDANALLPSRDAASHPGEIHRVSGSQSLASTQMHHAVDGTDLVRVVAPGGAVPVPGQPPSLYPRKAPGAEAWGMVIDLDLCIGCNGCVIACQAENNIPSVGKDQVLRGREMHWLRVDRYEDGEAIHFQPLPCMHCENAPCELGCPVNATVHGPDGINEMVYNRCIGTRTCASYCPYKVRRFNYYDFTKGGAAAQRNLEVTVRTRGVMEKCTFCVQRVAAARSDAARAHRPIQDGAVKTACQTACPTSAIVFGNLADPQSAVARSRADRRNYGLLEELNTWPRTTYLARIRAEEG